MSETCLIQLAQSLCSPERVMMEDLCDMAITVKFFSSLRESLNKSTESLNSTDIGTVIDAWTKATNGAEMPDNILVAINMDYVDLTQEVQDGDEVAFFPPVTGG